MISKKSSQNEALEMLRTLRELTEGFQETAPLLHSVVRQMYKSITGQDVMGYFHAAEKIDNASTDEKDIMLLLIVQFVCHILDEAAKDEVLLDKLQAIFPNHEILEDL